MADPDLHPDAVEAEDWANSDTDYVLAMIVWNLGVLAKEIKRIADALADRPDSTLDAP
jgi:hypothetical protein